MLLGLDNATIEPKAIDSGDNGATSSSLGGADGENVVISDIAVAVSHDKERSSLIVGGEEAGVRGGGDVVERENDTDSVLGEVEASQGAISGD